MPLKAFNTEDEPTINMTPMIDCVFLLLIFFMVGTTFSKQERQLDVKLPTVATAAPLTSTPDEIVVTIVSNGVVQLGAEKLSLTQLQAHLVQAKKRFAEQAVVVRGSGPDPYQFVADVLEVCEQAEISSISLASRLREKNDKK